MDPDNILPPSVWVSIDKVERQFVEWLQEDVSPLLEERETQDLWTRYSGSIDAIHKFKTSEQEFEQYSDDEKIQIKQSVNNYRLLVIENFNPDDEQLEDINVRLDYLSQAVDRLNRFDWKAVAISTVIGIATNLAVESEGGRQLFELFQEAFSQIILLLQ